ncbi:hypothetical protein BCIN_10g01140 [Botrytis cinerea B05.10]|uniref:Uncharacterized protein n=2 Tax=Botryotinia fuckeliana TaxID=40559 RepID=A0A384JU60_BOTFB|nr:hypothetical protein BCIN_10g01140 [Botrytis cinerea B05.10]ATZ54093.1 hypothetical protein BCIN_10g01140 [Botrytis cinerea B05.10]
MKAIDRYKVICFTRLVAQKQNLRSCIYKKSHTKIHLKFTQDDNGPEYGTGRYPEKPHQESKMATSQGPLVLTRPSICLVSKKCDNQASGTLKYLTMTMALRSFLLGF